MAVVSEGPMRSSRKIWGVLSFIAFILTIPLGNWIVTHWGVSCVPSGPCVIPVWPGVMAPSAVLLAGLALVLRDALQSLLGLYWALLAIAIGAVCSAYLAPSSVVLGSTAAFVFSEVADSLVYTPLRRRYPSMAIIISGFVGALVDSVIFLSLAFGSLDYLLGQVLGKFWMTLLAGILLFVIRKYALRSISG